MLAPLDSERRLRVAEAISTTVRLAYKAPDDRSGRPVPVPVAEAVEALLLVAATLIAEAPDACFRLALIRNAGVVLARGVEAGRSAIAQRDRAELGLPKHQNIVAN